MRVTRVSRPERPRTPSDKVYHHCTPEEQGYRDIHDPETKNQQQRVAHPSEAWRIKEPGEQKVVNKELVTPGGSTNTGVFRKVNNKESVPTGSKNALANNERMHCATHRCYTSNFIQSNWSVSPDRTWALVWCPPVATIVSCKTSATCRCVRVGLQHLRLKTQAYSSNQGTYESRWKT